LELMSISLMDMSGMRRTPRQQSIAAMENAVNLDRQLWCWVGMLLGTIMILPGCAHDAAVQRLSLAEQSELHTYNKMMTTAQARTYLSKASAAERTAYLRQLGLVQRFEALDPLDRDAVRSGFPRVGMSAEALLFVWGKPYYTDGDARRSAHWHYLGSSLSLGASGNRYGRLSNRVDVYLVNGKVVSWIDGPNTDDDKGGGDDFGS
jgi:hypothetical protein